MTEPAITGPSPTPRPSSRRPAIAGGVFRAGLLASGNPAPGSLERSRGHDARCVELLNITRPNLVADMHRRLLRTGADMLFTNTSGAAPQLLDRYRMHDEAFAVSYLGAEIASRVAREASSGGSRPRVIGDVRMPWHLPVHGFITGTVVEAAVASMTSAQIAGGVDSICLRASRHSSHLVAAFNGARAGMAEAGRRVPVMVSVRHDALDPSLGRGDIVSDLVAAATLARSLGATALSIESQSPGDAASAALVDLAETVDGPLFVAPGVPEAMSRHCAAHPAVSWRLAFVGADKPAQAWRLSRFTPAKAQRPSRPLESSNDRGGNLSTPRVPRTGAA